MTTNQSAEELVREPPEVTLWLDEFASLLGFERIAESLPGNFPPSYVYAGFMIPIFTAFDFGYDLFVIGGEVHIYYLNPYYALNPFLLLGAVYGARKLRKEYATAVREMNLEDRAQTHEADDLVDTVPQKLPWVLFVIGATVQFLPSVTDPSGLVFTDYVMNYFVLPFVYTPIVIQFLAVYFSIEFIAPFRLWRSTVGIDFLDPEGVGGLRPLGELVKTAYYYIGAGLIGYAFVIYAPLIDTGWVPNTGVNVIFTTVWIISIGTVAFAVLILHRFMRREKRAELQRLEAELSAHIDSRYDILEYEIQDDRQEYVQNLQDRIQKVSKTREYPATFTIWTQILLSIALPKAFQLFISGL
ncbi:uncharacterized protein Nmlp_2604 [Natronomonas moolapensis 8.8.11]|uniref:Uncharacterized protein n=1 Tax=Natronomonas moolapensis (strain DSM 18674 / CECT 7526 / JCM 14361 / 8.8.11) TaxID=268739 RepID=M1XRC3_NATM8|nr:OmpH family outer membrane protein [Natronomonas moolapensis]CCQ36763.1 uncharacterized protein Nmlp_2604 [Natronomonas moolapensis 8.8.11]